MKMLRKSLVLALLVFMIAETFAAKYIILRPKGRPTPKRPVIIIRVRRDAQLSDPHTDIPRAPATGDHPVLPPYIDDIKQDPNRRYARSVDSPSAKRGGGSHTTSGSSRDTGATHPGYNRRNTRSLHKLPFLPTNPVTLPPFFPRPDLPIPSTRPFPIYARNARSVEDVYLNPTNAAAEPMKPLLHRPLNRPFPIPNRPVRSIQEEDEIEEYTIDEEELHERFARDLEGFKKPSHRDVIIPNWNPHARSNPWNAIGGKKH